MTYGEQIRNFQHIDETTNQIIELIKNQTVQGGFPVLVNLGSEKPQRLLDFAMSQWNNLNAVGSLLPGAIPYRDNEIMNYTPKLESSDFTRN
jgi:nucleoside-diphosphate-sugar epimerase